MGGDIDKQGVARAYARWAPVYDFVFGKVFAPGRQRSDHAPPSRRAGRRAGAFSKSASAPAFRCPITRASTGSSASICPSRCCARRMSAWSRSALTNIDSLAVMDAERMALADGAFDVVVAQFVITAVPHPEATLDEFVRVTQAGRRNHSGQSHRRRNGARAECSSCVSRRSRASSAGGRNSASAAWPTGRRATAACASSSAGHCRRWAISR